MSDTLDTAPTRVEPGLVDDYMEAYVSWREESAAVQLAYDRWQGVSGPDGGLAFVAYRAALDREQRAADLLCESSERITAATGSRVAA